ncbi:MAG: class I SAM-dependent methyltransferase [Thermoanaerobaculia bacterium]
MLLPRSVAEFPSGVPVSAYMETVARAQVAAVQRYLARLPESVDVLDVAAGDGTFSRNLYEQFAFKAFRATWVDQDSDSLAQGAEAAGFEVRRVVANLERDEWSQPIRERRFHCALISLLFHHVEPKSYEQILRSVAGLLHRGGKLLMVEVCGGLFPEVRWQDAVESILSCVDATGLHHESCVLEVSAVIDQTYTFQYLATLARAPAVGRHT